MLLSKKIGTGGMTEFSFKMDLEPPNKKFLVGLIDRVIEKDGNYFILDFKTTKKGEWRKTTSSILADLQLKCYSWVVHKTFKVDPSKIKVALYYLTDAQMVSAKYSSQTVEQASDKLLKVYNEIYSSNPDAVVGTVGEKTCKWCDYRTICPFFQNSGLKL
jgi:CRISPR/Cas system-associated exonuclease Cas4 (RecB family)